MERHERNTGRRNGVARVYWLEIHRGLHPEDVTGDGGRRPAHRKARLVRMITGRLERT